MGIPHDGEALGTTDPVRLNPDYWVAFFWKRVMATHQSSHCNAHSHHARTHTPHSTGTSRRGIQPHCCCVDQVMGSKVFNATAGITSIGPNVRAYG